MDEDGRRWFSTREAFWVGRLGFHAGNDRFMDADLERMLAVLGAMARRVLHVAERVYDLFEGQQDYYLFHRRWLIAQRLVDPTGEALTTEGSAVLLMLVATRPSQVRAVPVGTDAVATMHPRDASRTEVAAWLDRVDSFAAGLPFRFERREFARKAALALVGEQLGGVAPIRRTIWQQSFSDFASRDRFHVWLAVRLDRWEAWGDMAYGRGGPVLTEHLLAMVMMEPADPEGSVASAHARRLL